MRKLLALAIVATSLGVAAPAFAQACKTEIAKGDLTSEQALALYDCLKQDLRAGYTAGGDALTKEYQSWKAVATGPAAPGTHGERFLMTYANDVAFDEYVKYAEERGPLPVGSILAKESFNVNKKGEMQKGPLFFMTKVAAGGDAAKYGDWFYAAVQPNGKEMKIKQEFCHGCHGAYDTQDSLGYPSEEVRLSSN